MEYPDPPARHATERTTAQSEPDSHEMLSVAEVAELLHVSKNWVYRTFQHEVPPARYANQLRWPKRKVIEFIESSTTTPGRSVADRIHQPITQTWRKSNG